MIPSLAAVITAAGSSSRFSEGVKKEYLSIEGHTVLSRSVRPFLEIPSVRCVIVTYPEGSADETVVALEDIADISDPPVLLVQGGPTRFRSVKNALTELEKLPIPFDYIAVHDGARPYIDSSFIISTLAAAYVAGGAAPAMPLTDSVREIGSDGMISSCPRKKNMFTLQTPQIFERSNLLRAYKSFAGDDADDDIEVYVNAGYRATVLPGKKENIKITLASDIPDAQSQIAIYIEERNRGRLSGRASARMRELMRGGGEA